CSSDDITLFSQRLPSQSYTLSLHDALPISRIQQNSRSARSQENVLIMFMNSPESGKRFQLATAPVCLVIGALMMTACRGIPTERDRKSTRLNSSHEWISYAVFCLKKKKPKY